MMSEDNAPRIEVRENGFLRITNVSSITGTDGHTLENKPVQVLCRCGHSKNKPYCDGSHKRQGFDGSPSDMAGRDKGYMYEGAEITVHYTKILCSHAGECVARLSAVFDPEKRPWITPDNGSVDAIKDVVRACPSGALRFSQPSQDPTHIDGETVAIKIDKNGPYRVSNVELADAAWAAGASQKSYVLCRCGLSKNKPFCDGTHLDVKWSDEN